MSLAVDNCLSGAEEGCEAPGAAVPWLKAGTETAQPGVAQIRPAATEGNPRTATRAFKV